MAKTNMRRKPFCEKNYDFRLQTFSRWSSFMFSAQSLYSTFECIDLEQLLASCSRRFRTQKTTQRPQWVENLGCFLQSGRCLCWRQAPRQAPRASNGGAPRLAWRLPHTFGGRSSININCRRALRSVPGQAARTTTSRGASWSWYKKLLQHQFKHKCSILIQQKCIVTNRDLLTVS